MAVDLAERLRQLEGGAAVALRLDPHDYADEYFAVLSATLRDIGSETNAHTIYVSVTNPAALVWSLAQALDVRAERLSFVDAISHIMMNYRDPLPNATYVESPRMLEEIMLRIEYLQRRHPSPRSIVVVDSVNSLAIHNPKDLLSEFFHILLNNLKSRQCLALVLSVSEDPSSELDQMLSLVVDETIDCGRGAA
jgi:KaiC/GvpD/RAD55 family RecA-like ATPase